MSDAAIREMMGGGDVPEMGDPPWAAPPDLGSATVAIVTTAGLLAPGDAAFGAEGDTSFRMIDAAERNLRVGHWSPNFDRSGMAADLNVAFPMDRLVELADDGTIGAVAPRHVAFVGNQHDTLETIRLDSGPAAAELLADDGVDLVLLIPV